MAILVDKKSKVIVQGITGSAGRFHTERMLAYGTNIVAGTSPGKGGQKVFELPVYDTVEECVQNHGADT
ncbi:MAG: succinate--CoA ligase subunit alpha, partial [Candidatus Zixiibacteriota bacterium]